MGRFRYVLTAPLQLGPAALVELRPFAVALACGDAVISAALQSYCSRGLHLKIGADQSDGDETLWLLPRPNIIDLKPGASMRIRIGLRLGALHVERAFSLVLRELAQRRDAPLPAEITLPLVITPIDADAALRAA